MRLEFQEYLESIGVEGAFLARAEVVLALYEELVPDLVAKAKLFVTDHIDEEGKRKYGSLWLLTPEAMMEAKEFLQNVNIDFASITSGVEHCEITTRDFSLKETTDESRMSLRFRLASNITGDFQATRNNCSVLLELLREYIIPLAGV